MRKLRKLFIILLIFVFAITLTKITVNADNGASHRTYTVDSNNDLIPTQDAYIAVKKVTKMTFSCDQIAERWVAGRYTGKAKRELELAQADCDELVSKWYGFQLLDEFIDEIWNSETTIQSERIAEYVGRTKIAEFFQTTSAKDVEEFKDECSCGFSGTPIDGSPFDRDASDSYAEEYWDAHHE